MSERMKFRLSFDEISEIKRDVTCGAAFADRISFNLALQLARLNRTSREDFEVLWEIRHLENGVRTTTKAALQFKHPPLHPFWHKHFSTARHTFRNIGERWNLSRGEGNKDLRRMIEEVADHEGDNPARWPGSIAHKLVMEGLVDRASAGKITGDWIIFAEHNGQNYYLSIATHEDGQIGSAAERLYTDLKRSCSFEFPFLFAET